MNVIFLIARDSIRALLHQRLLIALILVSLGLTVVSTIIMNFQRRQINDEFLDGADMNSPAFKNMSEEDKRRMQETMEQSMSTIEAFFYAAGSFGGSLVSLFIFSTAVTSEIRRGTIRLTLSKPISRIQYLLGKYLGGVVVMAAYAIIASLAMVVFSASSHVELSPVMKWAPWLMFCRQLMLGSLAMLLSLFVHPAIAGALAFFAGNGFYSVHNPLYYVLPSYAPFNIFFQILQGAFVDGHDVALLTLYAMDFVILMLLLSWWRFQRKEVC
ncbi:MAG TPA: ABC transporter permease subunit [Alphaproteobacteria bacterium]|nr:ABC transporter permease subunit [Alphaproteobacteria bacterium]